jgi:hypothetical protein
VEGILVFSLTGTKSENILIGGFCFLAVLGIELRALCMLDKHSTTELYLQLHG